MFAIKDWQDSPRLFHLDWLPNWCVYNLKKSPREDETDIFTGIYSYQVKPISVIDINIRI